MTTATATPELCLRVRAVPENVPVVRQAMGAVAATRGASDEVRCAVALAVTEAAANVVRHAYPHRGPGVLEIEADSRPDVLEVTVRDDGVGTAPGSPSPGIGAGLPLIAAVADRVSVVDRGPGTELRMTFSLAG